VSRLGRPIPDTAFQMIERLTVRSIEVPCLVRGLHPYCWVPKNTKRTNYSACSTGWGHVYSAHRVSWHLLRGDLPQELDIDHLCRVHACWNPWHGDPVTPQVNTQRSIPYRSRRQVREPEAVYVPPERPFLRRTAAARRAGVPLCRINTWLRTKQLTRYVNGLDQVFVSIPELDALIAPHTADDASRSA
jgi:hypothetical protein